MLHLTPRFCILCFTGLPFVSVGHAAFTSAELTSGSIEVMSGNSESIWREVFGNYDYNTDQQTGQGSADIIGTATDPGFYTAYDTNGTTGAGQHGDDFLAFRVRTNEQNGNKNYYGGYLWVGIDADNDNDIDAYLNYTSNNTGTEISIFGPGAGANNSPNTTTVTAPTNTAAYIWTDPTYGDYRAVSWGDGTTGPGLDGGTTNNAGLAAGTDGNNDTSPDWYVSFQIPFASLVSFLNDETEMGVGNTIPGVTDQTPLRFVVASSTQPNSFNQDIGGIDGDDPGYNGDLTWDQQPGSPLSQPFTSVGVVPEPSSSLMAMFGGLGVILRRRRQS